MCDLKDPFHGCNVYKVHLDSLQEERMVETEELWTPPQDTKLPI